MLTPKTMRKDRPPARKPGLRNRAGFTLLELLLALGLSAVLMAAVAMAIDLYRRMTTAGQEELREARLVRAVLHKIESDIRSVIPPQASSNASAGSSGSTTSTGTSSSSSSSSSTVAAQVVTDPTSTAAQSVFGIYGDSRMLMLNALRPQRAQVLSAQVGASGSQQPMGANHADLKTIAYFVVGGAGSSAVAAPASGSQTTPSGVQATSGLARLEGDRLIVNYAMQSSMFTSAARIVAPEVTSIAFRYYDGMEWLLTWDGSTLQTLPRAIEVTITIAPEGQVQPAAVAAPTTSDQIRTYRHVIAVPVANASVAGTTTTSSGLTP